MKPPVTIKYSEAFKQQVLRDLEDGKFESHSAAMRAYGIRGGDTITKWMKKYGKEHLLGKVIKVQKPKELNEVKELRKRNRELESALADAHLKQRFDEAYLSIACEVAGIENIDEFKKKHAINR